MNENKTNSKTQYLFFIIDDEKYAMKASCVQEIVDFTTITRVPKSNLCVRGVTNIRGDLIAVVDPKVRFDMGYMNIQKRTSFIIVNILNSKKNEMIPIALMVDMVVEVEDILKENILDTPQFGVKLEGRYIENIIKLNNDYISVLDMDEVLNIQDLSQIG